VLTKVAVDGPTLVTVRVSVRLPTTLEEVSEGWFRS
jgi:hypothetical protein